MLLYTRLAPPKVPKRRSRAGCTYCKEKKKKCDEERPQCARCAERGLNCTYEPVKPRQRRKRNSLASATTASSTSSTTTPTTSLTPGLPSPTTPSISQLLNNRPPSSVRRFSCDGHDDSAFRGGSPPQHDWLTGREDHAAMFLDDLCESEMMSPLDSTFDTASLMTFPSTDLTTLSPMEFPPDFDEDERGDSGGADANGGALTAQQTSKSLHPDLAMIAPCPVGSPLNEFSIPVFSEFSDRPSRRALVDHFCNVLSHLIVFREETGNPFQQLVLPLTLQSTPVMNAIYALASAHLEYRGLETGEKAVYFHNQAIQGLARLIENDGKVNRNEVLAAIMLLVYYEVLVQRGRSNIVGGHLKGAMTIMCSNSPPTDPTAMFLERAFRFYDVIAALSFGTAPLSTAPAAGCLLPFPPMGALAASPLSNVDTLLGMATTLWPIMHRLSQLLPLKAELEKAIKANPLSSKVAVLRTEFQTNTEAIESALDNWQPCLPPGFATDEHDPTQIRVVRESVADERQPEVIRDIRDIEVEAEADRQATELDRLHSILNNALAYRHSAFVYLYRSIYGYPRAHAAVQAHTRLALAHCGATVQHAGPMGALLWPLFVSACEAAVESDRESARASFRAIEKRQGMTNIGRAWDIVQEVWMRADLIKEEEDDDEFVTFGVNSSSPHPLRAVKSAGADLWRRVSEEMGVSIVFG